MNNKNTNTPRAKTSRHGDWVNNTAYHADLKQYEDIGLPTKTVCNKSKEAGKPVPINTNGTEFCLSYHIVGFC